MKNYSFIIPHKNIPDLLQRCLDSIPQRDDVQVIVVDDNSDSSLVDFVHFPGLERPDVLCLFPKEGKGAGFARNVGLPYAKGKWLLFVDADDFLHQGVLTMLDAWVNSTCDIIHFDSDSVDCETLEPRDSRLKPISSYSTQTIRYAYSSACTKMFRREIVEQYQIRFGENVSYNDVMFSLRFDFYARSIGISRDVLYCATYRTSSITYGVTPEVMLSRLQVAIEYNRFLKEHRVAFPPINTYNYVQSANNECGFTTWLRAWKMYLCKEQLLLIYTNFVKWLQFKRDGLLQKLGFSVVDSPIITFLLPSAGYQPVGGFKVFYEYANRLVADGARVRIVYAGSLFWTKKKLRFKLSNIVRYLQRWSLGYSCRKWFPLDKRIRENWVWSLNYRHVPKSDIYIASSPYTAEYLKDYPVFPSKKFYFIQHYEKFGDVSDARLRATYHFDMQLMVIAKWLKAIMDEEKVPCVWIPNGFDFDCFKLRIPIEQKNKYRVTMLHHFWEVKGCRYGYEALALVKQKYPQLRVNVFGTPPRPDYLPEWYDYYRCPDVETHNRIYNEAAIYLGTSTHEGWGLTIGEAMMSGEAVVCTDNPGYREMVTPDETALLSEVCNARGLADHVIQLITDDTLRFRLAHAGHAHIQQFTWDRSYALLRKTLNV